MHDADNSTSHIKLRESAIFFIIMAFYFSSNLVLRWLRYPLFHAQGAYGWPPVPVPITIYHIWMTCLPVIFWALLIYFSASRVKFLMNRTILAFFSLLTLVSLELDMNWFEMSHHHATLADLRLFLMESWHDHFGIRQSDVTRFLTKFLFHTVSCAVVWLLSVHIGKLQAIRRIRLPNSGILFLIVLIFVLADSALVNYAAGSSGDRRPSSWRTLSRYNPLRLTLLDGLWPDMTGRIADIEAANQAFTQTTLPEGQRYKTSAQPPISNSGAQYDVIVIMVESFNTHLVNETDMPNWRDLASQSTFLANHYSTGNNTHTGLLGLLYGSPVAFYDGTKPSNVQQSPFLELLKTHGFRTKQITTEVTTHRRMGDYLKNFTEQPFETKSDPALIPELRQALTWPEKKFLLLFYYGTHFPYQHAARFDKYNPEVSETFDFTSPRLREYEKEVINRYKNCLQEFDEWLGAALREIDLTKTIVVVTGDHGEEFFETGLLGHACSLSEPMIRTPCMIHFPSTDGTVFQPITSHADIMPSIGDAQGWELGFESFGRSIFGTSPTNSPRSAVAARTAAFNPVEAWAVITEDSKSVLAGRRGEKLKIEALSDRMGNNVFFAENPERWQANFQEANRFQSLLLK